MNHRTTRLLTAAAVVGAGLIVCHRIRTMRRVLLAERAAARLSDASHTRDVDALRARLAEARAVPTVLTAAEAVIDRAIARYTTNPQDGGPNA